METSGKGEVPTRTNGVTTGPVSRGRARRNWSRGEDTAYPRRDGKTPEPLLQSGVGFWHIVRRIGGRL